MTLCCRVGRMNWPEPNFEPVTLLIGCDNPRPTGNTAKTNHPLARSRPTLNLSLYWWVEQVCGVFVCDGG